MAALRWQASAEDSANYLECAVLKDFSGQFCKKAGRSVETCEERSLIS